MPPETTLTANGQTVTFDADKLAQLEKAARQATDHLSEMERRNELRSAVSAAEDLVWTAQTDHELDARSRKERDLPPAPPEDEPSPHAAFWCKRVSKTLTSRAQGDWYREDEISEVRDDLLEDLAELRRLPEFATIATWGIEIRWTLRAFLQRDVLLEETKPGRSKLVPAADREVHEDGLEHAPAFRLELSLPWFLLADEDQRRRGLHHLLAHFGVRGGEQKPCLRKPDIASFASTLGRFGVQGMRETLAVAHAQRHPEHRERVLKFGVDPATGQGLMWPSWEVAKLRAEAKAKPPAPKAQAAQQREVKLTGKDAAAEQGGDA